MISPEQYITNYYNSCIQIKKKNYTSFIYDPIHIRKLKLNSLNDDNNNIKYNKTKDSIIIFTLDKHNKYIRINHNIIWSILVDVYKLNYIQIDSLIKNIFNLNKKYYITYF